jgi:hypothetical protein
MKKFLSLTVICVAIALVSLPLAYGQEKAAPGGQEKGAPGGQEKAAPQAEKTFQGQLTKVDANAKSISVKGAGDAEMLFQYNDRTQVVGPQKDIQGLATQTGTQLKVTYREAGPDSRLATKIEIVEKK